MSESIEELRARLNKIIDGERDRSARLRGATAWRRMPEDSRSDCLAWRPVDGGRELLMYNNALDDPIYLAFEPVSETENLTMGMHEKATQYVDGLIATVALRLGMGSESPAYADLREELTTAYQQGWLDRETRNK